MPKRFVKGGSAGARPCPHNQMLVGASLTLSLSRLIDWVIGENRLRSFHELEQSISAIAVGHEAGNFLIGDIVRRGCLHLFFAVAPNHQVPIADAGKELDTITTERACQVGYNRSSFFSGDMTGGKVLHHDITAAAPKVTRLQRNAISLGPSLTPMLAASKGDRPV